MTKSFEEQMLKKLDLILRVLSLQVAPDKSITERVGLLNLAGLSNQEIAEILNISAGTVRALVSQLKKKRG